MVSVIMNLCASHYIINKQTQVIEGYLRACLTHAGMFVTELTYVPLLSFNIFALVTANNLLPPPLFWPCHSTMALICGHCNRCCILRNSPFSPVTVATLTVFKVPPKICYISRKMVARILFSTRYHTKTGDGQY